MTGGNKDIRIDEAASFGVIIPGLEIIQAGFGIVDIATVAEGVIFAEGIGKVTGSGQDITPSIVGILNNSYTGVVQDSNHITLQIGNIVVNSAVVGNGHRHSAGIVGKEQGIATDRHLAQLATIVNIPVDSTAICPLGSHTVCVIGIAPSDTFLGQGSQLSAVFPSVSPGTIAQNIANGIIGNILTVVGSQQIAPVGIAVPVVYSFGWCTQCASGVGVLLPGKNVARDLGDRKTIPFFSFRQKEM